MDTPKRYPCTLMHPGLFPAFLLDPFNPPKIKVMAEINAEKLIFLSSGGQAKALGSETLGNISSVTVQRLSINAQRLEIFQKTLRRMALVAAIGFIYFLLFHSPGLVYSILIGLAGATASGPLFFLFNGGFTINHEVTRFHFIPLEQGKPFYLEMEPERESEFHQALLSAGLKFEENEQM